VEKALADILTGHGGGVYAPLLVLAILVIVFLGRALSKAYSENRNQEKQHYEKRIEESSKLLVTLERTNTSNATMVTATEARAEAFNEMVRGFAVLVNTTEAGRDRAREHASRVEGELRELHDKMETMQRSIERLRIYHGNDA
jgi:hypothetical protein